MTKKKKTRVREREWLPAKGVGCPASSRKTRETSGVGFPGGRWSDTGNEREGDDRPTLGTRSASPAVENRMGDERGLPDAEERGRSIGLWRMSPKDKGEGEWSSPGGEGDRQRVGEVGRQMGVGGRCLPLPQYLF